MNSILEQINSTGAAFVQFALPVLVQSSILIAILLLANFLLRNRVRAVFRYWLWMLVLVKLVLPPTLSSPVSVGHWLGGQFQSIKAVAVTTGAGRDVSQRAAEVDVPQAQESAFVEAGDTAPLPAMAEPAVAEADSLPAGPIVSAPPVTWQGALFLAWLAVVAAMVLLLGQRAMFVYGLVAQAKEADAPMVDTFRSCCERMRVRGKVGLKVSANAASPAVCGLFRPVVLLPQNLGSNMGPGHLRAVLLHELAHIKRGDLWVNLVQTLLQIFYFYNPLLWLANAVIRRVREQAVDESVQVAMGESARQYPQTLVDVAKLALERPALSLRLIGVVESKSLLKERVKRMLSRPIPKTAKLGFVGLTAIIITAALLLPMAKAMSKPPAFVVKGTVTDAETGRPVAGAKVGDIERYAEGKQWTTTDANGNYSYKTWYEEHSIKCEEVGYKTETSKLLTKLFGSEKEKTINFQLIPEKGLKQSEYKATLPNGVTVELVGVCEYPSEGKQWWRPDGSLTDQSPYKARDKYIISDYNEETYQLVEFAVKISHPGYEDVSVQIVVPTAVRTSVTNADEDEHNISIKSIACAVPKLFSELKVFKAGVAYGQWQKLSSINTELSQHLTDDTALGKVIWDIPKESKGRATISLAHTLSGQNSTVFAEDMSGNLIKAPGSWTGGSTGKYEFYLPLAQIKKFHFMTRPYQWVEFKNVSLKPNFKTDVQIEVGKQTKNIKSEKEDNKGVEFLTILLYEGYAVFNGKDLHGLEEIAMALSSVSDRNKSILQVVATANVQNSSDWNAMKNLFYAWGREYGYKDVVFLDKEKSEVQIEVKTPTVQVEAEDWKDKWQRWEEQMRQWGEEFGEKYGEQMEQWGEEFGEQWEQWGKQMEEWGRQMQQWQQKRRPSMPVMPQMPITPQTPMMPPIPQAPVMPPLASQNPAVQVERFRKDNDRFDVELALRKSITNKLHEANIRFEDMILNVLPNLTAECKIFRPKGATQENYSDQIEGEVQIEYVGNGIWEVRGTKDLKDIQVDISTPVSMYHIVQVEEKGFKGQSFESNNFELKPDMKLIYVKSETPFYVSKYEVTVAQYNQFLNELKQGKYKHERCYEPNCQRSHIPRPWPRQEPNHPVSGITWFDAYAFCKWLGPEYQLPSRMHYRCMVFNDPHTSLKPINEFISGDGININKNDDINVKGIVGLFSSVKEYTIDHSTDLPGREDDIYIFESDVNRSNIAFAHLTPYGRDKIFGFRVVKPANKISPDQVETESLDKEKSKTAKVLRIVVYEGDKPQPDVTLIYPLAGLKIANTLIPEQAKEQMAAQGIDLGEVIKQVDNGLGPTTLLDVKDGNEHVIISLE